MIQYVEKLFQETKTIILPGLGALTITNPDTQELMFMPFLKHDDGALAGFIEKEAGISNDEAKKMVSDEIHAMLNDLESGKTVTFGNFGSFKKGVDGDMEFENSEEQSEEANDTPTPVTSSAADSKAEQEAAEKKAAEDEAKKKAEQEAAAKKAAEDEAKKKAEQEAAAKKATEDEAKKKAEQEAAAKKAAEDEAKKKAEQEAAAKKTAEDEAKKKAEQETAAKKTAEDEAKRKAEQEDKSNAVVPPVIPVSEKPKATRATVNQVIPDATDTNKDTSGKNILEKEEIAANQKKLDDLRRQQENKKEKKKRGAGFYILLALLFIIVAGGTFIALNYEAAKEYLPFLGEETAVASSGDEELDEMNELVGGDEEEEPADEEIAGDEELDPDEAAEEEEEEVPVEEEEVQEPEPNPEPTPTISGTNDQPFHIVAGVFSDASNAERLAEKIRGMGYPAKTFPRGSQTVVSVQSYATASEAQAALSSVTDAAPKGWVLEWR